jgi:uncharacterized protein YjeT (DUF2065 family)
MGYEIYSDHPQSQQRKHADFDAWSFWAPQNAPWTGVGIPDMARLLAGGQPGLQPRQWRDDREAVRGVRARPGTRLRRAGGLLQGHGCRLGLAVPGKGLILLGTLGQHVTHQLRKRQRRICEWIFHRGDGVFCCRGGD